MTGAPLPPGNLTRLLEHLLRLQEAAPSSPEAAALTAELWARLDPADPAAWPDLNRLLPLARLVDNARFDLGDPVQKRAGGGRWRGHVTGLYCGSLTPLGYAVESAFEPGSVQIYPEKALETRSAGEQP